MKVQIRVDDPHTRAIWESAQQAKLEVDGCPSWKRSLDTVRSKDPVRNDPMRTSSTGLCVRTLEVVLRRVQDLISAETSMEETTRDFFGGDPLDPSSGVRVQVLSDLETELKLLMENPHA